MLKTSVNWGEGCVGRVLSGHLPNNMVLPTGIIFFTNDPLHRRNGSGTGLRSQKLQQIS